jgi:hypothetical protein
MEAIDWLKNLFQTRKIGFMDRGEPVLGNVSILTVV